MDYQGRLGWGPHARKRGRTEHAYAPIGARERGGPCSMLYASIDKLVAHFIFTLGFACICTCTYANLQSQKLYSQEPLSSSFRVLCLACAQAGLARALTGLRVPLVRSLLRLLVFKDLAPLLASCQALSTPSL